EDGRKYSIEERPTSKAIQTGKAIKDFVIGIYRPHKKDRVWVLINSDPILDENGNVQHIVSSVKDITERKRMEEELLAKQISHQKQITQATIDGQENERTEIGKELHDNIGQQLTTIKLFLDMARTTSDDSTIEMITMALKGISDVINEVRNMSRSLVPSTLKDLGLVESIEELVDSFQRTQRLIITFEPASFEEELIPENQKLTMFRIVQEQLTNIIKYAEAKHVKILLYTEGPDNILEIKDDGIGFEVKKIRKGLGFTNIKNRAEVFGGHATIFSKPGKGCSVKITFPVTAKA
ncbi:MAG TPA: ATP-binding protein, partial [Flavisolibacter sp.]|nr:ATP-binding protein [Flavisolibacter sp.]